MASLADMLAQAEARARANGYAVAALPRGLTVIIDYRDPAQQQIKFGRLATAWPSPDEISICRRNGLEIPPGADMTRREQGNYNVIAYTWPAPAQPATEQAS